MNQITINEKYLPLWNSSKRYFWLVGGRGSGKSFAVSRFLVQLTFIEGHGVLFTRYTMRSAEISIIPEFTGMIKRLNLSRFFLVKKDSIYNIATGSFIIFRGIKTSEGVQTANLKSIPGITTWVLDEAEELRDEDVFETINLSVRQSSKRNRVILLMNGADEGHFTYSFFKNNDECEKIYTTYLDNLENLSPSFLKDCERLKRENPEKYEYVLLGKPKPLGYGSVYKWNETEAFPKVAGRTVYALDFGFAGDESAFVKVTVAGGDIYFETLIYEKGLTIDVLTELIKPFKPNEVIADSARPDSIAYMNKQGLRVIPAIKPKIEDRIELIKSYNLIIKSSDFYSKNELINYVRKQDGRPIDAYNHALDALGYGVWYLLSKNTQMAFGLLKKNKK